MPGGISTSSFRSSTVRPSPLQAGQGSSICCPTPRQAGQVWLRTNSPNALRDTLEAAGAAAGAAGDRARAGRGPAPVAGGAGDGDRERHFSLRAARRLGELYLDLDTQVRPARARG